MFECFLRVPPRKIPLAVREIGICQTVIHVGRARIRCGIEHHDLDRSFGIPGLHVFVAHEVHNGFRKQRGLGVMLARFFQHLRYLGCATWLINPVQGMYFFGYRSRICSRRGMSWCLNEGSHIPVHDLARQLWMDREHVCSVASISVMYQLFSWI